jgi:hypothetical protein
VNFRRTRRIGLAAGLDLRWFNRRVLPQTGRVTDEAAQPVLYTGHPRAVAGAAGRSRPREDHRGPGPGRVDGDLYPRLTWERERRGVDGDVKGGRDAQLVAETDRDDRGVPLVARLAVEGY